MIDATPVEGLYRALVAKDVDAVRAVLDDDVMMHFGGRSRFSGNHRGRDDVGSALGELSTLRPKLPDAWDVCVSDHHAVLIDWFEAERDGETFLGYVAFVCAVEDGRIVRLFPYFDDQYAFDRFFAPTD